MDHGRGVVQSCPTGIYGREWVVSTTVGYSRASRARIIRDLFVWFGSQVETGVAFGRAVVVTGTQWTVFSLGNWLRNYLHVTTQAGRVWIWLRELAVEPDGVVPRELGEPAGNLFVNLSSDSAGGFLTGHDSLVNATAEITVNVAVTFINDALESRAIPTHIEIAMVHRTSSVSIGEDEWLLGILGLAGFIVETDGVVVHLVEDTGKVDWEVRGAVTTVWSSTTIRNVGFMISGIGVLSVPTALEVELSANTARARLLWKEVMLGANPVEIQTEERNGQLFGTSHRRCLSGISRDHAEIIGEDGGFSGLVGEEVVGDWATRNELKRAVRVLEV